jgi:hypothetical protein
MIEKDYTKNIFNIKSINEFWHLVNFAETYQKKHNTVYSKYTSSQKPRTLQNNKSVNLPAFLPIRFFKTFQVFSGERKIEQIFESSGTTGTQTSKHYVQNLKLYNKSLLEGFKLFYGNPTNFTFLALLPGYIERTNASLVYMLNSLMSEGNSKYNGFYLRDFETLNRTIALLENNKSKYILWGVSHALIEYSETYKQKIEHGIIMETGGSKGHTKEWVRNELHNKIKLGLQTNKIHSEYGMTELLSQAYNLGTQKFKCPPWMKVIVREPNDPFAINDQGNGVLNIIDLANINSCCFIETEDIGTVYEDGSFEITGRFDNSDLRGCNLMV